MENRKNTQTFADNTARGLAVPDAIGQLAIQINTNAIYSATSLAAGGWAAPPASVPITTNYIPKGTGTSIADGTWAFSGNDILPNVAGSNIGSAGNYIGTIFLGSTLRYVSTLIFNEGGTETARFDSGGRFGIGTTNFTIPNGSPAFFAMDNTAGRVTTRGEAMWWSDSTNTISGYVQPYLAGGKFYFGSYSNHLMTFVTNNTERAIIDTSGNFGVGVITGLTSRVQIQGAGNTSASYGLKIHDNSGTSNTLTVRDDRRVGIGGVSNPTSPLTVGLFPVPTSLGFPHLHIGPSQWGNGLGDYSTIGFGYRDNSGAIYPAIELGMVNTSGNTGSGYGDLVFATRNNTGNNPPTEIMRITSTQQVSIGTTLPAATAIVEIASTTQGFLPPRMTTAQRNAITSPAEALMVYDSDIKGWFGYDGTSWIQL